MISEDVYDELLAIKDAAESAVAVHIAEDTLEAIRDIKRSLRNVEHMVNGIKEA